MDTPRTSLLDLHPVEALLVLLWISAAALHRLVADPPRPLRKRPPIAGSDVFTVKWISCTRPTESLITASQIRSAMAAAADETIKQLRQPQASAAPAVGIAPGLTVTELRTMARQQGLVLVGGRPIHKARKPDLLAALDA